MWQKQNDQQLLQPASHSCFSCYFLHDFHFYFHSHWIINVSRFSLPKFLSILFPRLHLVFTMLSNRSDRPYHQHMEANHLIMIIYGRKSWNVLWDQQSFWALINLFLGLQLFAHPKTIVSRFSTTLCHRKLQKCIKNQYRSSWYEANVNGCSKLSYHTMFGTPEL